MENSDKKGKGTFSHNDLKRIIIILFLIAFPGFTNKALLAETKIMSFRKNKMVKKI